MLYADRGAHHSGVDFSPRSRRKQVLIFSPLEETVPTAAMAFARDVFPWRGPHAPVRLADARSAIPMPMARGWMPLSGRRPSRHFAPTQRASYDDLSWGQVAASVLAGIACAAVSESKVRHPSESQDSSWREFRARLVQKEQAESGKDMLQSEDAGWLHSTTLIEKGSVLISRSGDQFTLDQQYFLHSIILILKRDQGGDVGVILNRPSEWSVEDLGVQRPNALKEAELQLRKLLASLANLGGPRVEEQPWKVSYGGPLHSARDAERGQPTLLCLYRCDGDSDQGEEVYVAHNPLKG